MRIDKNLTRSDLKIKTTDRIESKRIGAMESTVDMEMDVDVQGERKTLSGQALKKWKYQKYIKDYLRCIASVDDDVGRLLDYLEKAGLKENTIVITLPTKGFFSETMTGLISDSCMKNHCGCRF